MIFIGAAIPANGYFHLKRKPISILLHIRLSEASIEPENSDSKPIALITNLVEGKVEKV